MIQARASAIVKPFIIYLQLGHLVYSLRSSIEALILDRSYTALSVRKPDHPQNILLQQTYTTVTLRIPLIDPYSR